MKKNSLPPGLQKDLDREKFCRTISSLISDILSKYKYACNASIKKSDLGKNNSAIWFLSAFEDDLSHGNGKNHSLRVLKNVLEIVRKYNFVGTLTKVDYLILIYTSLFHDMDKWTNKTHTDGITLVTEKDCCLFSDIEDGHGIRGAHYLSDRIKEKELSFPGLGKHEVDQLLEIICFHGAGSLHGCFADYTKPTRKELLLFLLFFVADMADDVFPRVAPDSTAPKKAQSARVRARRLIRNVKFGKISIFLHVDKTSKELKEMIKVENEKLHELSPLLIALGLPFKIDLVLKGKVVPYRIDVNNCRINFGAFDLKVVNREQPLVLSSSTLPGLYEKIVRAFYKVKVTGKRTHKDCFGPLVFEVTDVENDKAEKTKLRNTQGKTIKTIKDYTIKWLSDKIGDENDFYFGYTHGQRLKAY